MIPPELRALIASGPLTHLATVGSDGSPQVTVIWIGLDGEDIVSAHLGRWAKIRNIERDPRVVLSFAAPRDMAVVLNPYAVIRAHATVHAEETAAWELLTRLGDTYLASGARFPASPAPGFIVRYRPLHVGGVGPWAPSG